MIICRNDVCRPTVNIMSHFKIYQFDTTRRQGVVAGRVVAERGGGGDGRWQKKWR